MRMEEREEEDKKGRNEGTEEGDRLRIKILKENEEKE